MTILSEPLNPEPQTLSSKFETLNPKPLALLESGGPQAEARGRGDHRLFHSDPTCRCNKSESPKTLFEFFRLMAFVS